MCMWEAQAEGSMPDHHERMHNFLKPDENTYRQILAQKKTQTQTNQSKQSNQTHNKNPFQPNPTQPKPWNKVVSHCWYVAHCWYVTNPSFYIFRLESDKTLVYKQYALYFKRLNISWVI